MSTLSFFHFTNSCDVFCCRQASMYRARSVLNNLVPFVPSAAGPERFASWLLGSARSAGARVATSRHYNSPAAAEPFLNGSSSAYVEDMYNSWLADPKSVHVVSLIHYYSLSANIIIIDYILHCAGNILPLEANSQTILPNPCHYLSGKTPDF